MIKIALRNKKIGFIGAGNMTRTLVSSFIDKKIIEPENIFVSNRTPGKLEKLVSDYSVVGLKTNQEVVDAADIIVLAIKPKDIAEALQSLNRAFDKSHIVISLAAGVFLDQLSKHVTDVGEIIRVMPNTPLSIGKGVIGYCSVNSSESVDLLMDEMFSEISHVVKVSEGEMFNSLMVASSSGVGFIYELMIYWQEWLEQYGFDKELSKKITLQSFKGAVALAESQSQLSLQDLQNKVATKKGVTAAGLDSMRELELERVLRYSFEKAILKDDEISKQFNQN